MDKKARRLTQSISALRTRRHLVAGSRMSGLLSLVAVCLLAAVPLVVRDPYTLNTFVLALVWVVVVAAWDLITGFAGIYSFGQVAFFVVGAYGCGMLSNDLPISPWITILGGALIAGIVGVAIGIPCLRIKGQYVALVTYSLHLLLPSVISHGRVFGTGGTSGLLVLRGLSIGSYTFSPLDPTPSYYVALAMAALIVYLIYFRIMHSRLGLAMTALRDADNFVKSLGVNEQTIKLVVFGLSAFFTGVAGGFYVHYETGISPNTLGLNLFLLLMVMLFVGGIARYPGAVVGAFVFTFLNQNMNSLGAYRPAILGCLVILAMLLTPKGFVAAIEDVIRGRRRGDRHSAIEAGGTVEEAGSVIELASPKE